MEPKLVVAAKPGAVELLMASMSLAIGILSSLMRTRMGNPPDIFLFATIMNFTNVMCAFAGKRADAPGTARGKDFDYNYNEEGILNFLDVAPGNKSREGCVNDSPPQSLHTTLKAMCTPDTPFACDRSGLSSNVKFTTLHLLMLLATILVFPMTAAALTISPGFRVLAGIGASGTAIAVIPLRTLPEVHNTAWIITYVAWAVFFSAYLGMQVLLIPSEMSYRRKWFLSCIIIAAVHFSIGLAQTPTTLEDAFTVFGPLIATVCTYVMSLIFSGNSEIDANAHREGIAVVRAAFCE